MKFNNNGTLILVGLNYQVEHFCLWLVNATNGARIKGLYPNTAEKFNILPGGLNFDEADNIIVGYKDYLTNTFTISYIDLEGGIFHQNQLLGEIESVSYLLYEPIKEMVIVGGQADDNPALMILYKDRNTNAWKAEY